MKIIPKEFVTTPIVYAVRDTQQIMVPVNCETVMWVKIADRCFYDDSNGILHFRFFDQFKATWGKILCPDEKNEHFDFYVPETILNGIAWNLSGSVQYLHYCKSFHVLCSDVRRNSFIFIIDYANFKVKALHTTFILMARGNT